MALVDVLIGGAIGILGTAAAPAIRHYLTEKSAQRRLREEKVQELIGLVYETDHWLDQRRSIDIYGNPGTPGMYPLPKAQAIAAIYFPSVSQDLTELHVLSLQYQMWIASAFKKRIDGSSAEISEGLEDVYRPYCIKLKSVTDSVELIAKTIS